MANLKQVALLEKGSAVWNQWREENPDAGIDLNQTNLKNLNLSSANFSNANLSQTNLSSADLINADFSNANLSNANLSNANLRETNLSNASLSYANLSYANLISANLSHTDLSYANLSDANLISANLSHADLFSTSLIFTDLFSADLSHANLSHANLNHAQALYANFTQAILTGACIANWEISSSTSLNAVKCDWIFRACNDKGRFSSRLPVAPDSIFAPGEFTQLFQITNVSRLSDMTCTKGIDWQSFPQSCQQFQQNQTDTDRLIHGIENKDDAFMVQQKVESDEVLRLLASLHTLSQLFPEHQQGEVQMQLDDLEIELRQPGREPKRIGKRLRRLITAGMTAATVTGGTMEKAALPGNANQFTQNVIELGAKVGLTNADLRLDS